MSTVQTVNIKHNASVDNNIVLDSAGNVGITAVNPVYRLSVVSSSDSVVNVQSTGTVQSSFVRIVGRQSSTDEEWNIVSTGAGLGAAALRFVRGTWTNTPFMVINTTGSVGIGAASPAQRLDVAGNVVLSGQSTADQFIRIGASRTGNGFSYLDLQGDTTYTSGLRIIRANGGANSQSAIEHRGTNQLSLITQEAAPITFYTNGANERMRITSDGRVGIGTASPINSLDVVGGNARVRWNVSTGSNACIQATTNVAANAYATQIYDADYHGFRVFGTDRFFVDGSFAYCIGVGARSGTGPVLTTNNSLGQLFRNAGYIEFNSDIGQIGLNYFVSDETKKDNIQPSVFSSSALVAQVNFISFDWKPESGQTGHVDVGVSAQQLQSLDGRLVKELSDGTLMVNEPALVAHLAKAVQELIAKNESLEARVAALETK